MRITRVDVIVCSPGRNFVTVRIETDGGVHGVGDATLNGRELAVAAYVRDHLADALLGRDPRRSEDIWHHLYRGAYWRRGPVTMTAIAAIDTALWDIKAKLAGMPLYQVLGGASRDGVLVYGHANGETIDDTVAAVGEYVAQGYRAVRAQCGVPGIATTYGVSADRMFYEPADAAVPTEHVWSTPPYLRIVPELFAALRDAYGWDLHLLHDVHHRLTPVEAARLGRDLEPFRLFWLEDPVPAEDQRSFELIRAHTTTPLAVGEVFSSIWDAQHLLEHRLIDYLRATVVHAGGITHLRRIADLAALHDVRTGCHGATDLSPVAMGAALHFDLWVPNFGIQEWMRHPVECDEVFPRAWSFADGYLHPGDATGLGVDIDVSAAERYPYRAASLPVNRLEDGTLWHW